MLKKNFNSSSNTIETFGIMPLTACSCDPDCHCACQTDTSKKANRKAEARRSDYAAHANVFKS